MIVIIKIFLVKTRIQVFFIDLISEKLILNVCITKGNVNRLNFFNVFNIRQKILILFFGQFMALKIPNIDFLNSK